MAVTNQTQAAAYCPVYNPQWFVSTSTQTAQPNFRYTVVLTDLISGGTVTKDVDKDPNNLFVFDASSFAEQYMTQVNPANLYGWQRNTGATRKVRVNVGETYGATPTYYAGSNYDYIVWNGSFDFLETQSFNYLNHIYSQANNIQLITNNKNPLYSWSPSASPEHYSLPENVIAGRSSYLYVHTTAVANEMQSITVIGYDANNVVLGTTTINNQYSSGTTYTDKYVFIDVGYEGLNNMPAGQCTGTYPIPVSTYDHWIVFDTSSWLPQSVPPAEAYTYPLKRFNMVCEERFDITAVHYQSPEGGFETQVCQKLSLMTTEATKSYYSKYPYSLTGYVPGFTYGIAIENVLTASSRDKITVNTDWLTEAQIAMLKDVISAPIVYADFGSTSGYVSMKCNNNTFQVRKKYNDKLLSASFDLEYTHFNVRQRG